MGSSRPRLSVRSKSRQVLTCSIRVPDSFCVDSLRPEPGYAWQDSRGRLSPHELDADGKNVALRRLC